MQDRQHRTIADWIQKFVGMPRRSKRPGFGFAIPHHHADDQIGIVERRAEGVRYAVAQFPTLMNRPWNLWRTVASKLARERESAEKLEHPGLVLALVRIDLGIGAFQVAIRNHRRC